VDQKVVGAGDVEYAEDLGQGQRVGAERVNQGPRVLTHADRDQGLHAHVEGSEVDIGVEAPQHAQFDQAPDPLQAGGRREPHHLGEPLVGDPGVLAERREDGHVEAIEIVPGPHDGIVCECRPRHDGPGPSAVDQPPTAGGACGWENLRHSR
jgi:hypothetical protein